MSKQLLGAIFCYPILNLADTLAEPGRSPTVGRFGYTVKGFSDQNFYGLNVRSP